MRKVILYLSLFLSFSTACVAQTGASAAQMFKDEQQKLVRHLRSISIDSVTVYPLARYFDAEANKIYNSIISDKELSEIEKEKAVRSLVYFMTQLSNNSVQQKLDVYDIPDALRSYNDVMKAITHHKPYLHLLVNAPPGRSQLLASAFTQYPEHNSLDEVSIYKRIAATPDFILPFLESRPDFRYADSLILDAAASSTQRFVAYLKNGKESVQDRIRKSKNKYVQQIIELSADKNATELYPFVIEIADGRMNAQEILTTRTDVLKYFQLLVNTMKTERLSKDSSSVFLKLLRNGIRQKALAFYVNQINELHTSPDATRFASVKKLRPEDYYYIMTSCGDELYTSSYIGLYKRLMEQLKNSSVDSVFDIVHYDNFPLFLRLAANYNVAVDFLRRMTVDAMESSLHRFIDGVERNPATALDRAMDIADFFSGLDSTVQINELVESQLRTNLNRCKTAQKYLGVKLYGTLLQVFTLVEQKKGMDKLWATLGNYEMLKRTALENKDREIVELVLFYGDEDGKWSYNSFLKCCNDSKYWTVTRTANWINVRSIGDYPVSIYANVPLDGEQELDIKAQDSLISYLHQQSLQPTVLIHRGHSYHLDKTLKRLEPSVKLAILGSCGGYNHSLSIATISPDVQVIGSKKTGSKSINEPMINVINDELMQGRDLQWSEIWTDLGARFNKDEQSASLFSEYFSPDNNLSLFVLKMFNL